MILRLVLVGLMLCGIGGLGTIGWVMMPHGNAAVPPAPVAKKVSVLAVNKDLRSGALLKPEDLVTAEVDASKVPDGALADEADARRSMSGGLVLRPIAKGDVLRMPGDALRPGDHGFLAAVLSPGSRAVTVGVDVVSGTAGLIWPGDRVDVILTQSIDDQQVAAGRRIAAETVLRNVRVIAIDQQLGQSGREPADKLEVAKTVTLEVPPAKSQLVQVAARLGRLSLALRSTLDDGDTAQAPAATWASDVTLALPAQSQVKLPTNMRVFQGSAEGREYKF